MPGYLSNVASYTGNSLGFVGNRVFDGGKWLFKKTGLAKADKFIENNSVYLHAIPYTLLGGYLFMELEESFRGDEQTSEYNLNNPLVPVGMCLAALSALVNTGAILYYRHKTSNRAQWSTSLAGVNAGESDDGSEGSSDNGDDDLEEGARFLNRFEEFTSHTIGITFYNFALGFGATVPFLYQRTSLAGVASLSILMSYILAKCELALHEANLNEAAEDHEQSSYAALYASLVTDVNAAQTPVEKLLAIWMPLGILGSHALAGIFGVNSALSAMKLLMNEDQEIPQELQIMLYLIIPIGAFSHSVSELQGFKNFFSNLKRLQTIFMSLTPRQKALFALKAFTASCTVLIHVMPEAIGFTLLVEKLSGRELDRITKSMLTVTGGVLFGVPDILTTSATTMLPALRRSFENNNEGLPLHNDIAVNVAGSIQLSQSKK
ncbi:MAG: hypothetical protein ABSF18_05210 [Gammaproteobacteria bacterium]|jgi:hypothetical protein